MNEVKIITATEASKLGLTNIYGTESHKAIAREARSQKIAVNWVKNSAGKMGGAREGMWVWEVIDMGGRKLGWAAMWN